MGGGTKKKPMLTGMGSSWGSSLNFYNLVSASCSSTDWYRRGCGDWGVLIRRRNGGGEEAASGTILGCVSAK